MRREIYLESPRQALLRLALMVLALGMIASRFVGCSAARADEVDTGAVLRMGDTVQHVGDGLRLAAADDFVEAAALPPDDNHKWFVSLVTTRGCAPCERLKKQWTAAAERAAAGQTPADGDEYLLALANPLDPKQSWSHFNVYDVTDRAQAWRFRNLTFTAYPTVVVQPPRNGRYGDPTIVVYKAVYAGDPVRLARDVSNAVKLFVARKAAGGFGQVGGDVGDWRVSPPWLNLPALPTPTPRPPSDEPVDVLPNLPNATPSPATVPAAPATGPPSPSSTGDELVVVTDADGGQDALGDPRIKAAVALLQRDAKTPLRTRLSDWHDAAKWLPLSRRELPAVVRVRDGQVTDKLSRDLLDLLTNDGGEAFPWSTVLGLVTSVLSGQFTWLAAIAAAVVLFRWWRRRQNKPPLVEPATLDQLQKLVAELLGRLQTPPKT